MRKIIMFNMVSVDGLFEGPHSDLSWHHVGEEFNRFAIDQLDSAGGLLFGRVTYLGMASYWPTEIAIRNDPDVAGKMNRIPKFVFSRTLEQANWSNSTLLKGDLAEEAARLKEQGGRDLLLFGSGSLATALTHLGLIDEYRLMVNPVILGAGTPMFKGVDERLNLRLVDSRAFQSGNVLLIYQPDKRT